MKKDIHPDYVVSQVRCSCGNTFTTHATKPELHVELCNECHPFFTGQQKFVDTGGRVQRFSDKFGGSGAAAVLEKEKAAKEAREAKAAEKAARAAEYEKKAAKQKKKEEAAAAAAEENAEQAEAPAADEAPAESVATEDTEAAAE